MENSSQWSYQTAQRLVELLQKTPNKNESENALNEILEALLIDELTIALHEEEPTGLRAFLKARCYARYAKEMISPMTMSEEEIEKYIDNGYRQILNLPAKKQKKGRPSNPSARIEKLAQLHFERMKTGLPQSEVIGDNEALRYHLKKSSKEEKRAAMIKALSLSQQEDIEITTCIKYFRKIDPAGVGRHLEMTLIKHFKKYAPDKMTLETLERLEKSELERLKNSVKGK